MSDNVTLADLVVALQDEYMKEFGDAEMALRATTASLNKILARNHRRAQRRSRLRLRQRNLRVINSRRTASIG